MRSWPAFVVAATVLSGCVSFTDPPPEEPRPCPGVVIALDPVRGDVNTTFLRAVVREDGSPKSGVDVQFTVPEDGGRSFTTLGSARSGADGAAYVDLGAKALADRHTAQVVEDATTLRADHTRRVADGETCTTRATAAFEPGKRRVVRPSGVVDDPRELTRRLREVQRALWQAAEADTVARLGDGSSACRLLYALAEDARRGGWLGREGVARLDDAAGSCVDSPRLAGSDLTAALP